MKITDRFEANRDVYGWTLTEHYEGRDKNGNAAPKTRDRYYGSLRQCCEAVVDLEAGRCVDAAQLCEVIDNAVWQIRQALREAA